jgi:hypothetical protein
MVFDMSLVRNIIGFGMGFSIGTLSLELLSGKVTPITSVICICLLTMSVTLFIFGHDYQE